MCGSNDDKLLEYRRLDRLHREQLAEEYNLESESNTIWQNAGGFSLVNVQWASFATGASAIFVVAIISLAFLICCCLRAKGMRQSKHRHRQLLSTISSTIVPGPPTGERSSAPESQSPGIHPSEAAKWVRTPSGWASVPCPYLPTLGPVIQLPFPQFPPISYDRSSLEWGGYPLNPFPRSDFGEAVTYHRRPALAQPSRFVEISVDEPVARRTCARKTTSVGTAPMSRSSSRTRFSIAPSESESEEEQLFVSSWRSLLHASEPALHPIRKTVGKKRSTGVFSGEN